MAEKAEREPHPAQPATEHEPHLPAPSVWPFVLAGAISLMAFGVVTSRAFSLAGAPVLAWALWGWVQELRHEG